MTHPGDKQDSKCISVMEESQKHEKEEEQTPEEPKQTQARKKGPHTDPQKSRKSSPKKRENVQTRGRTRSQR